MSLSLRDYFVSIISFISIFLEKSEASGRSLEGNTKKFIFISQMIKIPISFEHKGKEYKGYFTSDGGRKKIFHLYIDGSYYGQLKPYNDEWMFETSKQGMDGLAKYFGDHITKFLKKNS